MARQHGYLTGDDSELHLTEVGQREIDKLVGAIRRWLAEELTDWGAGDDELLTRALDNMANQFIDEDPDCFLLEKYPSPLAGDARAHEPREGAHPDMDTRLEACCDRASCIERLSRRRS